MLGVPARGPRPASRTGRTRSPRWSSPGWARPERYDRASRGMLELRDYLGRPGRAGHARDPGDDLLSALVQARDDDDALSHDEVIATGVLLLFAGHETTTNLIGNGLLALLQPPRPARACSRPATSAIGAAIEELLRYDGPAKTVVRLMAADVELRGQAAAARASGCSSARRSANRDPAVFADPGRARPHPPGEPRTSASASGCTTAWARRWPGWRPAVAIPRRPGPAARAAARPRRPSCLAAGAAQPRAHRPAGPVADVSRPGRPGPLRRVGHLRPDRPGPLRARGRPRPACCAPGEPGARARPGRRARPPTTSRKQWSPAPCRPSREDHA